MWCLLFVWFGCLFLRLRCFLLFTLFVFCNVGFCVLVFAFVVFWDVCVVCVLCVSLLVHVFACLVVLVCCVNVVVCFV